MRMLLFDKIFCSKRIKPMANEIKSEKSEAWRNVLAYWILGLGTEFGYVVMICAASDIINNFQSSVIRFACLFYF